LAATPVGHQVRAEAEVIKVEGNELSSRYRRATNGEIGNGTHQRIVINLRSFQRASRCQKRQRFGNRE